MTKSTTLSVLFAGLVIVSGACNQAPAQALPPGYAPAAPGVPLAPAAAAPSLPAAPAPVAAPSPAPAAGGDVVSIGIPACDAYYQRACNCSDASKRDMQCRFAGTLMRGWQTIARMDAARAAEACQRSEERLRNSCP